MFHFKFTIFIISILWLNPPNPPGTPSFLEQIWPPPGHRHHRGAMAPLAKDSSRCLAEALPMAGASEKAFFRTCCGRGQVGMGGSCSSTECFHGLDPNKQLLEMDNKSESNPTR